MKKLINRSIKERFRTCVKSVFKKNTKVHFTLGANDSCVSGVYAEGEIHIYENKNKGSDNLILTCFHEYFHKYFKEKMRSKTRERLLSDIQDGYKGAKKVNHYDLEEVLCELFSSVILFYITGKALYIDQFPGYRFKQPKVISDSFLNKKFKEMYHKEIRKYY